MRKKIFTFLLALAASVGMSWADEVTIVFAANNNTKEVTVELPHTFWCSFDDEDGELDLIIQELYGLSMGGFCDDDYAPTATGNAAVTAGKAGTTGEDHYITISDVFAGTATVAGSYYEWYQPLEEESKEAHEKEYSLTISIKNYTPEPVVVTANTLQLVAEPTKGSVAVTNLLGSGIVDNGDGTYTVPEGAEVTLLATPNEGYEFIGWKASSSICDFNECEFVALPTVDNPLTVDMYMTAAFMAEFAAVAPQPEPEPEGDGKLTGAFTINADGDQIVFSKGNLQYQASTTTWRFATNQYDMIGEDNANISDTYTGWIDLFGWGTGNCPTKKSTDDEDYSTFVDWGTNAISNGGNEANLWRTLTIQEWGYLIKTRTNAADLKGQATVAGVHGFVLLPDSWTLPTGLSFTAIPNDWTTNVYTAEQWAQMEAAGAVFLPATGYRNPDIVYVGEKGWYWSSDVLTANAAYDFEFTETNSRVFGSRHYFGQPVRLVTAIDAPTPAPVEDVDITPNVDPDHAGVYYSTFFDSANKYALPAGVEAYVATRDGANLLLSKIADAGQTIPADNAVILKSSVTPFTLTPSDAETVPVNAINSLKGTDVAIATPANCYVLGGADGVVGFYKYSGTNLNPHKAYVVFSGSNQAPRRMPFIFDAATGVENVQGNVQSTKVLRDGQLIIIRNGVEYNANGMMVK